ncbi:hypothetical protein HPB47_027062 [Ixodes persulcatus]|uniref:Uncharacterized protein n=1 Tax=Ixodes persulcatus TaxID=34615 RepID=A0AC60PYL5_IXOPE|nr:hypothetical protein HPB47_027062 [Ixodes persulcatus]
MMMAQCFQITPGVLKTVIQPGFGPRPNVGDNITVHCTGLLTNPPRKFWRLVPPASPHRLPFYEPVLPRPQVLDTCTVHATWLTQAGVATEEPFSGRRENMSRTQTRLSATSSERPVVAPVGVVPKSVTCGTQRLNLLSDRISFASNVESSWRGLSLLNRAVTIPPNADLQFEIQILAINGM